MAGCPALCSSGKVFRQNLALVRTGVFLIPFTVGVLSAIYGTILHLLDQSWGYSFVRQWAPNDSVFSVFTTFCSFISAFRTAHALSRYTDAAAFMHKLKGCWFDAASTLVAFSRNSDAPGDDVDNFNQTMARLISLLNALCFDELQQSDPTKRGNSFRFEILGTDDLDDDTQERILDSSHKVECVFQMIQQAVVDAMETKVLSIAPPILSRSFQELGTGLLTYHEAKKIAEAPLPPAYHLGTNIVLFGVVVVVPWMMALYTKGELSTFCLTMMGVFLVWFLNSVADALDNPFQQMSQTLEAPKIQRDLNAHLEQLLACACASTPRTEILIASRSGIDSTSTLKRQSMFQWRSKASGSQLPRQFSPSSDVPCLESSHVDAGQDEGQAEGDSVWRILSISNESNDDGGSSLCPDDPPGGPIPAVPAFAARLGNLQRGAPGIDDLCDEAVAIALAAWREGPEGDFEDRIWGSASEGLPGQDSDLGPLAEPASTTAPCASAGEEEQPESYHYEAEIIKGSAGLGLKMDFKQSGLNVSEIVAGASVDRYNASAPTTPIQVLDYICAVNGKEDSPQNMVTAMKAGEMLKLRMYRPATFNITLEKGGSPLGMELNFQRDSASLEVAGIAVGAVQDYNAAAAPEMEIRLKDVIKSVNGVSLDVHKMVEEIKTATELNLVLLRGPA